MAKLRKKDRKKSQEENTKPRIRASFRPIQPRTINQSKIVDAIKSHILTIITGTAGTGKTLLAVSEALRLLEIGRAKRLILIRPLVTVGDSIGYLPGDVLEKVAPYSTPLLYYIDDLLDCKGISLEYIKNGVIEIVPLALIRGRTFEDSIIILDEAQNTTPEEMHAALTRIGTNTSIVIVGDEQQVDLHQKQESGLTDLLDRMSNSKDVAVIEMSKDDIQRNEFLKTIHDWYEN